MQIPAEAYLGGSISRRLDALAAELSAAGVLAKAGGVVRREARRAADDARGLQVEAP